MAQAMRSVSKRPRKGHHQDCAKCCGFGVVAHTATTCPYGNNLRESFLALWRVQKGLNHLYHENGESRLTQAPESEDRGPASVKRPHCVMPTRGKPGCPC